MWRLHGYFTLAAQEEFYVHCRELRDWIADPPPPTADQERLLGEATRYHRAGQPERAEAICDQLLATDPAHALALRLLGGILSARCDHQGLKTRLLTALAYRPAGEFYFGLGLLAVRLGYLARAAEAFTIAVHRDAAANAPRAHLGRVLAQLAAATPDPPDCFRSLARRPDDPRALTAALLWAARRPEICPGADEAAVTYRAAMQLDPVSADACESLADLLESRGDHVSAAPLRERCGVIRQSSARPAMNPFAR